ncbi:MAG: hypothetical protein ACRD8Z_16730, partial [Nitrososphaeraceae archaeon]
YKLEMPKNDPSGKKHNIQNQEIFFVNGFNGELLSLSGKKRTKFVSKLNPFLSLSQRNADLASNDIAERNPTIMIQEISNLLWFLNPSYGRLCG